MGKTVSIIQRRLTHYRVPLFETMRSLLESQGIRLQLLHGEPTNQERMKNDSAELPWAESLATRYFVRDRVCWQPFADKTATSALVIVTHENKLINNIPALISPWRRNKIALWGHGRNMQSQTEHSPAEIFKRWMLKRPDWWFTYTNTTAEGVSAAGFPQERITVLNNSIDTRSLQQAVEQAKIEPLAKLREEFGINLGKTALYLGSLYPDKRIDLLIQIAKQVRGRLPEFQLVIAGDGPDRQIAMSAAEDFSWIRYVGAVHGAKKAKLLASTDIIINPGVVGLSILDAFAAGLPLLTCRIPGHGPEISYLEHGVNGLIVENTASSCAQAIVETLENDVALHRMQQNATQSSAEYSIEQMANRFCSGICRCLQE